MAKYRDHLPQCDGDFFLTDGGLETTLVYHDGIELPHFAAFDLLASKPGRQRLRDYFDPYVDLARKAGAGFIIESPTWRANADWGKRLGYSAASLAARNREAIDLMHEVREAHEGDGLPIVISGCIGPRGDGYIPGEEMSPMAAATYHAPQIEAFAEAGADMVTGLTATNMNEAIGIVDAAQAAGMPVAISFTVETDGRLPTGQSLWDAIAAIDIATNEAAAYFMINCAHPTHFRETLRRGGTSLRRLRGLRANASCMSHEELDDAEELDTGNPEELGRQHAELLSLFPSITILDGCCGTDLRHIEHISRAGQRLLKKAA